MGAVKLKEIIDYNSVEEFICENKRLPSVNESRPLYDSLWSKYINNLDREEKKIALYNNSLKQKEIKKFIPVSTIKFRMQMKNEKNIISIEYYERWGMYKISVFVDCKRKEDVCKFRKFIPNFFEGFEIELFRATIFQKIVFYIERLFKIPQYKS